MDAVSTAPAATIDEVIAQLQAIGSALPVGDGVACFNRMYLEVTQGVAGQVQQGAFDDAAWMSRLDVVFANRYLAAVEASPEAPPRSGWKPLLDARSSAGIEPIQFALAGMNIHINYDLPHAVVATCVELGTEPEPHHADYQRVDALLDAAEQSVRESFEPADVRQTDQHLAAVTNLVCNWSLNEARDAAWDTALALWAVRDNHRAAGLLSGALARVVGLASRAVLTPV